MEENSHSEDLVRTHDVEQLPTQWIEVDKNAHLRHAGQGTIEPKMKSRLVARDALSKEVNSTDSPTADNEAIHLLCSWAASKSAQFVSLCAVALAICKAFGR